jgi:hypothetical protein
MPFGLAACLAASRQNVAMAANAPASAAGNPALERVCLADPDRRDAFVDGRQTAAYFRGTATVRSIEAASAADGPAEKAVVVLPGYLLPDNTRGEPVHEGS